MKVIDDLKRSKVSLRPSAVTIGVFDALHLGHQKLISRMLKISDDEGLVPCLVTFDPYPRETLDGRPKNERLLLRQEKLDLLKESGIKAVAFIKFTRHFSQINAEDFIEKLLVGKLGMKQMIIGEDFTLGKNRKGDTGYLHKMSRALGFVLTVEKIHSKGKKKIKSSLIRELLLEGSVAEVRRLMGRNYSLTGKVIKGFGIGSAMSYPTANICVPEKMIPGHGIYVTVSTVGRKKYPSLTYIGTSPTFKKGKFSIETYILSYNNKIYGRNLKIEFIKFLRSDKKFSNAETLKKQIKRDVEKAKKMTNFDPAIRNHLK